MSVLAASIPSALSPNSPQGANDLLVVGPGVLGSYLGKLWKDQLPDSCVVGCTNTDKSHDRLRAMGLEPVVKAQLPNRKFAHVAFCAPPSGSTDYAAEVRAALQLWDSSAPQGSFVFTSSMSVCAAENGQRVDEEHFELVPRGKGPSTDRLLDAEEAVLQANGNVVRLVGLYHAQRGAHTFFLKAQEVPRWGGYVVNLIHYEDAARITMSVLRGEGSGPFRGRAFIGCDNHPTTFQDMVADCNRSGVPSLQGEVKWTLPKEQSSAGKYVTNPSTRKALGDWVPVHDSFHDFMAQGAKDYYTTSGLF